MKIKIDADTVTLSQLLMLRTTIEQHAGTTPVEIEFAAANRLVATLHLDATVTLGPSLEKSLKAIPSVL